MSSTTTTVTRSLPDPVDPMFADFFEGLARHRIVVRACTACGTRQWPPRPLCLSCHGTEFEPAEVAGEGDDAVVYTFTVVHRGFDPYFSRHVPYAVLVVDLAGLRLMGNLTGADPAALAEIGCGSAVRVAFEDDAGRTFLAFTPAAGATR
ncbi:MAG: OB-fold domain-containing protein [Pseudonocardia sp.]|nr:OB-fold domain-containing protein [Pseudonocardia sp.]